MGGAKRYPSLQSLVDGFREGLNPSYALRHPLRSSCPALCCLVPGIHVLTAWQQKGRGWPAQARTSPAMTGAYTTGLTPGSEVTRSRNFAPRISKLRYWSNDAQAGDNSTTGSASPDASASRAALATATSRVSEI